MGMRFSVLQNSPLLVDEKVWKIDLCVCVCVCTYLYERGEERGEGKSVCASVSVCVSKSEHECVSMCVCVCVCVCVRVNGDKPSQTLILSGEETEWISSPLPPVPVPCSQQQSLLQTAPSPNQCLHKLPMTLS